ncbi:MAG: hypothetical protein B7Z54_01690 [Sphingobacteriales bacterium 12-47-4]|nr:MAG: hypothetical protein B7Z54_01690 [Sphingobacteriales bacterium 12-47-4]
MGSNNALNVFGFKLQQQSVQASDFDPVKLNDPGSYSDFTTKLLVKQPLLNLDMMQARKAAKGQAKVYQLVQNRTAQAIGLQVELVFIQLQSTYEAEGVLQQAKMAADSLYTFIQNRVEEGLLQRSDALNVQVWQSSLQAQLAETKSGLLDLSDRLSLMMGVKGGSLYRVDPLKETENAYSFLDSLPAQRADLLAMEKAIDASGKMIRSTKMAFLPRINAFGSYQFNDNSALGMKSGSYLAGLQLTWDIFKGHQVKNKTRTQSLEQLRMMQELGVRKEQGQVELDQVARQYADALVSIQRQETAIQFASESLRILLDRYEQGLANSTDVLLAQTQLSQQKLGRVQARARQAMAAAQLRFLTQTSNQ